MTTDTTTNRTRRQLLRAGTALGAWLWVGPAMANSDELAAAIRSFAAGAPVRTGRVLLDIAPSWTTATPCRSQ